MKWRTQQPGDIRTRTIFALIPRRCDDGQTRWLERVTMTERWEPCWDEIYWVPLSIRAAHPEEAK